MTDVQPLIEQVEASEFSHVVVMLSPPDGIRWRPQTESACNLMAEILGPDARSMPKQEFIDVLKAL